MARDDSNNRNSVDVSFGSARLATRGLAIFVILGLFVVLIVHGVITMREMSELRETIRDTNAQIQCLTLALSGDPLGAQRCVSGPVRRAPREPADGL